MDKITGYKLLEEDSPSELSEQVGELLEKGWQPFGSPFNTKDNNLCQAMVQVRKESTGGPLS